MPLDERMSLEPARAIVPAAAADAGADSLQPAA